MTLQQARSKIEQQLTRPRHDSKSLGNLPTNAHLRSHGRVKISVNNKHDTDRLPEKIVLARFVNLHPSDVAKRGVGAGESEQDPE
jgi:hypothetical protein